MKINLSFELTDAQKKVIFEIETDMENPQAAGRKKGVDPQTVGGHPGPPRPRLPLRFLQGAHLRIQIKGWIVKDGFTIQTQQ